MVDYINDWNDKNIEILDVEGFEFKMLSEVIESKLYEYNILDHQDEDYINENGFERWVESNRPNAKESLNELFELKPELTKHFKPI